MSVIFEYQIKFDNFTGELYPVVKMNYTFSGHETFACRYLWLKKGFDNHSLIKDRRFEQAIIEFGVGKNMVSSIRYWLKSFGFDDDGQNNILNEIFGLENVGFDPFLEDINTLWILHYLLIKNEFASSYYLFFNEFFNRSEFSFNEFHYFINQKLLENKAKTSEKTIENDLKVFKSMYVRPRKVVRSMEDEYSGLFLDLNFFVEQNNGQYFINSKTYNTISPYVILFVILDQNIDQTSISFNDMLNSINSIGKVFCLNQAALYEILGQLVETFDFLVFSEDAGVRELQIKKSQYRNPIEIIREYYEKH